MTVETRYFRSDTHTVNTFEVKILGTSKSGTGGSEEVDWQSRVQQPAYVRLYVDKVLEDGTQVHICEGAAVTISPNETAVKSAGLSVPETSLAETDAILAEVQYSLDGETWAGLSSVVLGADWITEQLGATILNAATWTVYYDLDYESIYNPFLRRYTNYLRFRYDGDFQSRIENFTYGEVVAVVKKYVGDGLVWYDSG